MRIDPRHFIWGTLGLAVTSASGQITLDGSLGPTGPINPLASRYVIPAHVGCEVGSNLFHSFSQFSVPEATMAEFASGTQTTTIIARITGGEVSDIRGRIHTSASLFLLNPAGFIFGENASLDIGGSFSAIAGDRIAHTDGGFFMASASGDIILSAAPVSAFGFLGQHSGMIEVRGTLNVSRGNLSLIGRTVSLTDAGLVANGDIAIAAAGGGIREVQAGYNLPDAETLGGRVTAVRTRMIPLEAGKTVSIRGGDVDFSDTKVNFSGFDIVAPSSLGVSATGSITLTSDTSLGANSGESTAENGITLRAGGAVSLDRSQIVSFANGSARAADINVFAGSLSITGTGGETFSGITSSTQSSGVGGETRIGVSGATVIENGGQIAALSLSSGDAGKVSLSTGSLTVTGLAVDGSGQADFVTGVIGIAESSGKGGILSVSAGNIALLHGGLIDSSTSGAGAGGEIRVAADHICIDRMGSVFFTGIGSDTESFGDAGNITVCADRLTLRNGGLVSSSTAGAGNAGDISIFTEEFSASGSGLDTGFVFNRDSGVTAGSVDKGFGEPSGSGGKILIDSTHFLLTDSAKILTRSAGTGRAGDITICGAGFESSGNAEISVVGLSADAGSLVIDMRGDISVRNSIITAAAGSDGGNITITSGGVILLRDSKVTANAEENGGNISFSKARHLVLNRTPVSASAVEGGGGKITVTTGTFFKSASELNVNSEHGEPGTVEIRTLDTLGGGQETDEEELLDPDDILQPDCALRNPDTGGSFTKGGRGGTRRLPGGYLPSFRIIE